MKRISCRSLLYACGLTAAMLAMTACGSNNTTVATTAAAGGTGTAAAGSTDGYIDDL